MLQAVAERLQNCVREADTVARLGGDEFVVLVMNTGGESEKRLVDRLMANVASVNERRGLPYQVSLSVGIAHYEPDAPGRIEDLLEKADSLMYEQKKMRKEPEVQE